MWESFFFLRGISTSSLIPENRPAMQSVCQHYHSHTVCWGVTFKPLFKAESVKCVFACTQTGSVCVCVMQYSLCESTTVMLITALLEGSSLLLSSSNQSLQNWKKKKSLQSSIVSRGNHFYLFFFSWHSSCALSRSVFSASHKIKSCGISSFVTLHLADKQAENWACAYLPRHFVLFLSNASRSLLEPLPLYRYWTVCIDLPRTPSDFGLILRAKPFHETLHIRCPSCSKVTEVLQI